MSQHWVCQVLRTSNSLPSFARMIAAKGSTMPALQRFKKPFIVTNIFCCFLFFQKKWDFCFILFSFVCSDQINVMGLLFIIFQLMCIDIFPLESSRAPSWDVKNCACRNESILIMQIWVPLIGMFCFINYILLSEVKLYLNNFTEIVTKILNCAPCVPFLI